MSEPKMLRSVALVHGDELDRVCVCFFRERKRGF